MSDSPERRPGVRVFVMAGAVCAFLAVALGAFGAHGLKNIVEADLLIIFETGVRYHFYHALGLFAVAFVNSRASCRCGRAAGWLFLFGILVFSGSLYVLALSGLRWLGAITPIGGVAFLAGWVCLLIAARKL